MSFAVKRFNVVRNILDKSIFDENIIHIILKYYWKDLKNKRKILLDWIDLDWNNLSANINAIDLLENNQDKIDWESLCLNPNAINLLKENQNKIDWYLLSQNKNAINLLHLRTFKTPIFKCS